MRRCVKCKGEPVIDLKSTNAAFCEEHFIEYFLRQVGRAVEKYKMMAGGQQVLVAVSGGKDSMALWDALLSLGYEADGLHIDLGIGEYSRKSRLVCEKFAAVRGARLYVLSLVDTYGTNMEEIVRRTRRVSCSVCGTVKRYLMNMVVQQKGYRVVATGHNLDDETAALLSNLFSWQEGYLARQYPCLPSTHPRLPARIKPLVRLGEQETEMYCRVKGIEFWAGDCPLARGATSLVYKDLVNSLEDKMPGTKRRFLFGFWERGRRNFTGEPVELKDCSLCGQPTTADTCLFCRLMQKAGINPLSQP
ncbi:MAG: ATP-binding protein, partial [Desulfofundulus sp.]